MAYLATRNERNCFYSTEYGAQIKSDCEALSVERKTGIRYGGERVAVTIETMLGDKSGELAGSRESSVRPLSSKISQGNR